MKICKHYVLGNCKKEDCKFEHIDNICRNHFMGDCKRPHCKFSHEHKFQKFNNQKIKNTETFTPDHSEPSIRIKFNEAIKNGNEICICNNIFNSSNNLYDQLLNEINQDVYKPWHGDSHLIADDNHEIDWKSYSKTFDFIIRELCKYFCMTPGATRFNYYTDTQDWKPYHHDAAALKPNKAKTQNITVGLSLGYTREISFESTHSNRSDRLRFNFPLENKTVYAFGNQVNIDFRHGIPQLETFSNSGRISIIIWGYSSLID